MSAEAVYIPCQCPKCVHRPVHGVCRCRFCGGDCPQDIRAAQRARRKAHATEVAGKLLAMEDTRPLTDREALELEQALAYLTRN